MASSNLADLLTTEEIPVRLRCAVCSRLAVDAFRLPCCDQNACSNCHAELPETCPSCSHSPLSKDDCKPNKSLRATVRNFVKGEEKKRQQKGAAVEAQLAKEAEEPASAVEADATVREQFPSVNEEGAAVETTEPVEPLNESATNDVNADVKAEGIADEVKPARPDEENGDQSLDVKDDASDASSVEIRLSPPPQDPSEDAPIDEGNFGPPSGPQNGMDQFNGQDGSNFNMMGNMNSFGPFGMNGSMNGMNGMGPMMGMPNMNPMMQQMMAGNFGNMNMMNMPPMMVNQMMNQMNQMNQMGFSGGVNGWGQQNGMNNMMNWSENYSDNGYFRGPRGYQGAKYGRGRGGRNGFYQGNRFRGQMNGPQGSGHFAGRSSFQDHQSNGYSQDAGTQGRPHSRRSSNAISKQDSASENVVEAAEEVKPETDQAARDILNKHSMRHYRKQMESKQAAEAAGSDDNRAESSAANDAEGDVPMQIDHEQIVEQPLANVATNLPEESRDNNLDIEIDYDDGTNTASDLGPNVPQGPAAQYGTNSDWRGRGRGAHRGFRGGSFDSRGRGRGSAYNNIPVVTPSEPHGVGVVGAPTGPKALREGGPNVGFRGRANGYVNGRGGRASSFASRNGAVALSAGLPTAEISQSFHARRDRSPTPERPRSSARHSHDGRDRYENDYEYERDREQKRSRKHGDDRYDADDRYDDDASVDDRRGRRDKDKHRSSRRDRDRSTERRSRKHRDRSYDEDDYYKSKEKDSYSKSHDSSRRHRHESRRDRKDDYDTRDSRPKSSGRGLEERITRDPPTGPAPKREFKIVGRSRPVELESRTQKARDEPSDFESQKERIREERPDVDVYTLEREARQRERLAKEEQRRGSYATSGSAHRKRSRDDFEPYDSPRSNGDFSRKKSKYVPTTRRSSSKYDGNADMSAMLEKAERERESARY